MTFGQWRNSDSAVGLKPKRTIGENEANLMFQLSCRSSTLSRPTRSPCQMTGVSNERIVLNFSMWTKVTMLRLPVEETKRPISGSTVSMATPCPPAVRRRRHIRLTTYKCQKHKERKDNPPVAARGNISEICRCRNRRFLGRRSVSFDMVCRCRNSWRIGAATLPGRANRSPRTIHHDVQDPRKHQSYDANTEVTA